MTKFKTFAVVTALTGLASPAVAHVGDHSVATSSHWLVEHGLAMGGIAAVIAIAAGIYIWRKKA